MNDDAPSYRILPRPYAVALIVAGAVIGALAIWLATTGVERYGDSLAKAFDRNPERARAILVRDLRAVSVAAAILALTVSAWLARYGVRGLRTQAMPPPGAWVFEGQHTWTGAAAVSRARLLLAASAVILLLGLLAAAMMWRLPAVLLG